MLAQLKAVSLVKPFEKGRTVPGLLLCRDSDGADVEVVVKWRAGPEMKDIGGICELIAALLADDLDLKAPRPVIVEIAPDFHQGIPHVAVATRAAKSVGPNFGSIFIPGLVNWPTGRECPLHLRQASAEIFAFDVLIDNPDRRVGKPNLLSEGANLLLLDHEQAFSFLRGVVGWRPPWELRNPGHLSDHVFFSQLKGREHSFDRLTGALEGVSDQRLAEYAKLIPPDWNAGNDWTKQILDHLKQARQNRAALFAAITQLLR